MQCGNVVPSPTISETPHAFAPRMLAAQRLVHGLYVVVPLSWSYSLAITTSPPPCEVVSQTSHGKPNWNGSLAACASAPARAFFRPAGGAACVGSRPAGLPAWASALYSS